MTGDHLTPAMPNSPLPPSATESADGGVERLLTFSYLGWWFSCGAEQVDGQTFRPMVFCRAYGGGDAEGPEHRLPPDTDNVAYGSEPEALRHAEQQAIRWAHDRSGDGQGQF
jgi:hypothetical protein